MFECVIYFSLIWWIMKKFIFNCECVRKIVKSSRIFGLRLIWNGDCFMLLNYRGEIRFYFSLLNYRKCLGNLGKFRSCFELVYLGIKNLVKEVRII